MKRIILSTILMAFTYCAFAQVSDEDLAIIQSVFQKNKTEIIKSKMTFTDAQNKAFWPLYKEYQAKRRALGTQRVGIINDYLKSFDKLSGEQASSLVNRVFANDRAYTAVEQEYYPKFAAACGRLNAVKYYQLETYLQLIIKLHIQEEIPFIGELDKTKQ
jgi:hypothetical protein